jgi:iron(III) transport system substrate-binding protein
MKGISLFAGLLCLGLGFAADGHAQMEKKALAQVKEAAFKEGTFLWYDSIPTDEMKPVIDAFQKTYPQIKLQYLEVAAAARAARIMQESRAGGPTTDFVTTNARQIMTLAETGFVRAIDWKALGIPLEPQQVPNEYMMMTHASAYIFLHNTNKVSEAEAPKTLEDLTNPKWKGRMGAWVNLSGFLGLVPAWGEEKTTEFVKKMAANQPRLYTSPWSLADAAGAGEKDLAVFTPFNAALPTIKKSAPVKLNVLEPVAVSVLYGYLPKQGRNPNASLLFLTWLASTEGAVILEESTGRGNPYVKGTDMQKLLAGKTLSSGDLNYEVKNSDRLVELNKIYSQMFEGR